MAPSRPIASATGAGKTTLISLIPRFYEGVSGRILLDGADVRDITLKSLRDQVSLVLQEPLLFSGSIIDNIRYGRLEATDDEVMGFLDDEEILAAAPTRVFLDIDPGFGQMWQTLGLHEMFRYTQSSLQ